MTIPRRYENLEESHWVFDDQFIWYWLLGVFTIRDMYEQFQNIMKMGPFSQIMVSYFFLRSYHSLIRFFASLSFHRIFDKTELPASR